MYQMGQNLNTLRILINSTSLEIALCAYFANVHFHNRYGIALWGNSPSSKLIFKIQKRMIRILTHSMQTTSCIPLLKELNIMCLPCVHFSETIMFVKQDMLSGGQMLNKLQDTQIQHPSQKQPPPSFNIY